MSKNPIDEKVKKISLKRDFIYEVNILKKSKKLLGSLESKSFEPSLDSFLIHIRNLYEFFYGKGNGDKSHATHFSTSWNKKPTKEIKEVNIRINQYLSHISYTRVTKKYKLWNIPKIYKHFEDLITEFINKMNPKYLNQELKKLKK